MIEIQDMDVEAATLPEMENAHTIAEVELDVERRLRKEVEVLEIGDQTRQKPNKWKARLRKRKLRKTRL